MTDDKQRSKTSVWMEKLELTKVLFFKKCVCFYSTPQYIDKNMSDFHGISYSLDSIEERLLGKII